MVSWEHWWNGGIGTNCRSFKLALAPSDRWFAASRVVRRSDHARPVTGPSSARPRPGSASVSLAPTIGAAIGEYLARKDAWHASRVGVATWLGMLAGTVAKVAIVFLMVGVFVGALLI